MNHPARYLLFVSKGIACVICLVFLGVATAGNITEDYISASMITLRIASIAVLVIIGDILCSSFRNDLKAIIAKRPMPTFKTRFTNHGLTLHSVIMAIRDEKVMFLAIFNKRGGKIAELSNFCANTLCVDWTLLPSALPLGTIMVYNRPNSNTAFLPNDVEIFMRHRCSRAIVVVGDKTYEAFFLRSYSSAEAKNAKKRLKQLIRQIRCDQDHIIANETVAKEFGYTFLQRETATIST